MWQQPPAAVAAAARGNIKGRKITCSEFTCSESFLNEGICPADESLVQARDDVVTEAAGTHIKKDTRAI